MKHRLNHQLPDGTLIEFDFEIIDFAVENNQFTQDWSPGHFVVDQRVGLPQFVHIKGRLSEPMRVTMPTTKRKRK